MLVKYLAPTPFLYTISYSRREERDSQELEESLLLKLRSSLL